MDLIENYYIDEIEDIKNKINKIIFDNDYLKKENIHKNLIIENLIKLKEAKENYKEDEIKDIENNFNNPDIFNINEENEETEFLEYYEDNDSSISRSLSLDDHNFD